MKCEYAAEFVSALSDGERIPREAAEHIGQCKVCSQRLNAYSAMATELRRIASSQEQTALNSGSWESMPRAGFTWWRKVGTTMKIPRLAFASMLALILVLSGGLVLVRARTGQGGSVLLLTYKLDGATGECIVTTDGNPKTNRCSFASGVRGGGTVGASFRFASRDGERTQLGVSATYKRNSDTFRFIDDFKGIPETAIWIEPGEKQQIAIPGWGDFELAGEYLDYMPSLPLRPKETLDPKKNEFRIVSPVLVRGREVLFNLAGSNSTDSSDPEATLMIYYPGEGRYLISTVPFEDAVEGTVAPGQIKFSLDGEDYLLLTAMPTTRSEHVWVAHDPHYKLSEHMQGASDHESMFMVRSLGKLLQPQIHHIM
jgi:hypothetical protein